MREVSASSGPHLRALESDRVAVWCLDFLPSATEVYRLCSTNMEIELGGECYRPFPFSISAISEEGNGALTNLQITCSNLSDEFSGIAEANRGFTGATVVLRLALASQEGVAEQIFAETFRIQTARISRTDAVFTVGNEDLMGQDIPSRRFSGKCPLSYKGDLCGYAGAIATCDRTLNGSNGCTAHDNQARFGGWPAIPKA